MKHRLNRPELIERARLHYLTSCVSALYYGGGNSHSWEAGAAGARTSYGNGQGDIYTLAWDGEHLVGVVFQHESARSEARLPRDARNPLQVLPNLPAALVPLARSAAEHQENLVTAGLWAVGDEVELSHPWTVGVGPRGVGAFDVMHGFEQTTARAALFEHASALGTTNWIEAHSLSPDHAELVLRLAEAPVPYRMTAADVDVLLRAPLDTPPTLEHAYTARTMLAAVGIELEVPEHALRAAAHARAELELAVADPAP